MVICKPVVIHLDNKADVFEAGNRLVLSPEGKTVTEDVEIILDGKRYFLEVGDKVIITEQLYGFPVLPGDTPADKLIKYVQDNWLDWDIKNPTFRQAAQQFGILPAELNDLMSIQRHLQQSNQDPGLKKHLTTLTATQMGATPAAPDEFDDEEEEEEDDGSPSDEEEDGSPSDGSASDTQPVTTAMATKTPASPSDVPSSSVDSPSDANPPVSPTDSPADAGAESPIDTNPGAVGPASPSDSPIDSKTLNQVNNQQKPYMPAVLPDGTVWEGWVDGDTFIPDVQSPGPHHTIDQYLHVDANNKIIQQDTDHQPLDNDPRNQPRL